MSEVTETLSPGPSNRKFAFIVFFHTFAIGHAGLVVGILLSTELEYLGMISQDTQELFFLICIGFFFFLAGPFVGFRFSRSTSACILSFIALIASAVPMMILFIMQFLSPTFGLGMGLVGYVFWLIILICIAALLGASGFLARVFGVSVLFGDS